MGTVLIRNSNLLPSFVRILWPLWVESIEWSARAVTTSAKAYVRTVQVGDLDGLEHGKISGACQDHVQMGSVYAERLRESVFYQETSMRCFSSGWLFSGKCACVMC